MSWSGGFSVALASAVIMAGGCSKKKKKHAHPEVARYLMPAKKRTLVLETIRSYRRIGKPGKQRTRELVARRHKGGVEYVIRDVLHAKKSPVAAKLRIEAHSDGAWIAYQEAVDGRKVGPEGKRLLFPWPVRQGDRHAVDYRVRDGRRARGSLTVTNAGLARSLGGKRYAPCFEVTEVLRFSGGEKATGGPRAIRMRSVFCRDLGRFEVETRVEGQGAPWIYLDLSKKRLE